ncbi:MAG: hypothetical protein JNK12_13670 [Acidimicrobiales bacterium]|nr:hypothetical protein [Acidimicrobiales bacterium]
MSVPSGPLTCVGTTNGGPLAVVDGHGGVHDLDGAWSIDWWAGADDRWHLAGEEAAVRRRLVDATPVVETAMRIPTGDAVARAYGARLAGVAHDLVALEVANETTLPFALAVVLHAGAVRVDGSVAVLDGSATVRFARPPSRVFCGVDVATVRTGVLAGDAVEPAGAVEAPVVALLFPLAHTARLRATLVTADETGADAAGAAEDAVGETPEADQVARGWRAQLDRGVALRLPDERLTAAVDLARAEVLLAAGGTLDRAGSDQLAALLEALAHQGFVDEAWGVAGELLDRQHLNGRFGRGAAGRQVTVAVLRALGALAGTHVGAELGERVAGPVAKAAHRAAKDDEPGAADALEAAAALLRAADQPDAAAVSERAAAKRRPASPPVEPLDRLVAPGPVLGTDTGDGEAAADAPSGGPRPAGEGVGLRYAVPAAALLARVRPGLVDHSSRAGTGPSLDLFAGFPSAWLGQSVEVHEAPTRFGSLSCAVRWHGARPALLWDLQPPEGRAVPAGLTLRAPALDPSWSTTEPRGEALLAEPAPPPNLAGSFS